MAASLDRSGLLCDSQVLFSWNKSRAYRESICRNRQLRTEPWKRLVKIADRATISFHTLSLETSWIARWQSQSLFHCGWQKARYFVFFHRGFGFS